MGGPLDTKSAARLLMSAASLDAILIFLLTAIFGQRLLSYLRDLPHELIYVGIFVILLALYWCITELILGGRTFGRLILNLSLRDKNGMPLSRGKKIVRALHKLSNLGLSGLRLDGPAGYDSLSGSVWYSPLAPKAARPIKDWRLIVVNGSRKGTSLKFSSVPTYRRTGAIKIGRNKNWSDLTLTNDVNVSERHCVLMVRSGGLSLMDKGSTGHGSSNGTTLHGRKLTPNRWVPIGNADHFYVADIRVKLDR